MSEESFDRLIKRAMAEAKKEGLKVTVKVSFNFKELKNKKNIKKI